MASENVAVVVAHPDDEVLAFGGVMCRHADRGDKVRILIMATGMAARTQDGSIRSQDLADIRADAVEAAATLGVSDVSFSDFPDNRMDSVPLLDIVKHVERFLASTPFTTVYTHHHGDLNVDHEVVARAVMTSCRMLPGSVVRRIYAGEVLSSSEFAFSEHRFVPTSYVAIDRYLERKCRALECYRSEIRATPHPRSVDAIVALARLRGSECGLHAAEALRLVREVER